MILILMKLIVAMNLSGFFKFPSFSKKDNWIWSEKQGESSIECGAYALPCNLALYLDIFMSRNW